MNQMSDSKQNHRQRASGKDTLSNRIGPRLSQPLSFASFPMIIVTDDRIGVRFSYPLSIKNRDFKRKPVAADQVEAAVVLVDFKNLVQRFSESLGEEYPVDARVAHYNNISWAGLQDIVEGADNALRTFEETLPSRGAEMHDIATPFRKSLRVSFPDSIEGHSLPLTEADFTQFAPH